MRVIPSKGARSPSRTGDLNHAYHRDGFMKKPVLSADSLDPDYTDSGKQNLRKSVKSADDQSGLPNSKKIYVAGKLHPDMRVPFREIALGPTKSMSGQIEVNEPVRVYDTSGPWTDPEFHGDVEQGLPLLRAKWIRDRSDVEEIDGRKVQPIDDGYLSISHATVTAGRRENAGPARTRNGSHSAIPTPQSAIRRPLRATSHPVTQLWYARQGIITPEMEFIALRENGDHAGGQVSSLTRPPG